MNAIVQPKYTIPSLALSDSSLNGSGCMRKLELRKMYGHKRSENADTIATGAGHALHGAWQTFMATGSKDAGTWALVKRYPMHLQKSAMDSRSLEACYSAYLEMLANPIDSRYELATVMHNGKEEPAVEVPFRITFSDLSLFPDRDVPIYYDGFIDAILFDNLEQRYVVADIKTTQKRRTDYSITYENDPQCLPYAYVLEKALGQATTGLSVIYFVVYIDPVEPRALKYEFNKTQADIQEWAFGTAMDINRIRQMAALGFFPKNGKACDTWGACEYKQACDYKEASAIREQLDLTWGPREDSPRNSVLSNFDPWFELSLTIEGLV